MGTHSFDLQTALYTQMKTGSPVLDETGSAVEIYDDVPEGASYPYVVLGEETAVDVSAKDKDIFEHTLTIHAWSQYRGRRGIKAMMESIHDSLHNQSISVSGASLVNLRQEFQTTLLENDGITRHGVIRFRAVVSDS